MIARPALPPAILARGQHAHERLADLLVGQLDPEQRLARRSQQHEPVITQGALETLKNHSWPGNVRELRNVMERATLLAHDGAITADHVLLDEPVSENQTLDLMEPEFDAETAVFDPSLMRGEDEKGRIVRALEACGGNQTRAAKLLGVSRRTLINRLEQFDLPRPKKS